jgi:hypothetical protein
MCKYSIGDFVYLNTPVYHDKVKYKVVRCKYLDDKEINDVIDFKYEWKNKDKIYKDPYLYYFEYSDNVLPAHMVKTFRYINMLSSQF